MARACQREPGDPLRLVAGPLEVGDRARDRKHRAQVARDRRLARQQPEAFGFDFRLVSVYLLFAPEHQLCGVAIRLEQRLHGRLHLAGNELAHCMGAHAQV
jgi:hypothetical protein